MLYKIPFITTGYTIFYSTIKTIHVNKIFLYKQKMISAPERVLYYPLATGDKPPFFIY